MFGKNKEIKKIIKQESKTLQQSLIYDDQNNLTIKLTTREVKAALRTDPESKEFLAQFKPEFDSFLQDFRDYNVDLAESLKVELDSKCDKKLKDIFLKA